MKDVVVRVDGILPDGTEMSLSGEEMRFGYRRSAVKDLNLIVTEVTMELAEGDPAAIRAKMSELNRQRAEKQPLDVPSAGSTFKRPEGFYAAALIDQCGLKGYSVGGAQVSMKHAGFLVNSGDSSRDYLELVRTVQRIVRERAGVELETEIRIIGEEV
jgi:UDP-N-acetylmuramate dehydrogenase